LDENDVAQSLEEVEYVVKDEVVHIKTASFRYGLTNSETWSRSCRNRWRGSSRSSDS
jgi:hypothetical protein